LNATELSGGLLG